MKNLIKQIKESIKVVKGHEKFSVAHNSTKFIQSERITIFKWEEGKEKKIFGTPIAHWETSEIDWEWFFRFEQSRPFELNEEEKDIFWNISKFIFTILENHFKENEEIFLDHLLQRYRNVKKFYQENISSGNIEEN